MAESEEGEDVDLWDRFVNQGDQRALADLFQRHLVSLFAVARRVTGNQDDAEDAMQETFLQMLSSRPSLPPVVRPWAYLLGAVAHACQRIHRSRRRHRNRQVEIEHAMTNPLPELPRVGPREDHADAAVQRALAMLPDCYRLPVSLRFIEQLNLEDIATVLRRSPGTLRKQISRGLSMLRKDIRLREMALSSSALGALLSRSDPIDMPAGLAKRLQALADGPPIPSRILASSRRVPWWTKVLIASAAVVLLVSLGIARQTRNLSSRDDTQEDIFYPACREIYRRGSLCLLSPNLSVDPEIGPESLPRIAQELWAEGHQATLVTEAETAMLRIRMVGSRARLGAALPQKSPPLAHGAVEITFRVTHPKSFSMTYVLEGVEPLPQRCLPPTFITVLDDKRKYGESSIFEKDVWSTWRMEFLEVGHWQGRPVYEIAMGLSGKSWKHFGWWFGRPCLVGLDFSAGTCLDLRSLAVLALP